MMVVLVLALCAVALGGYKLGFTGAGTGAGDLTVLGYDNDGVWVWNDSRGGYDASGAITIGDVYFRDADLFYDEENGELSGTANTKIKFANGCNVKASSAITVLLAPGSVILEEFPDAPIALPDESEEFNYFYLRSDGFTTFKCEGYEGDVWNDDGPTELYYSPDDPSFYVSVGDIISVSPLLSMASGGRLMSFSIDRVTLGVSNSGLIAWRSEIDNEEGGRDSFNAHAVIGGDFTIKGLSVRDGEAAFRFDSDDLIKKGCFTGDLALFDVDWPFVDEDVEFELPLGEGVACIEDNELILHADVNMRDWEDLDLLPADLRAMINDMGAQEAEVNGWMDLETGDFEFEIIQDWPAFGFFDIDGALLVSNDGIGLSGTCEMEMGPIDFGDVVFTGTLDDSGLILTGEADASIPGFRNQRIEADFTVSTRTTGADLRVVLWGWTLNGTVSYIQHTFSSLTFDVGFNWEIIGGELTLLVTGAEVPRIPNTISLEATGYLLGISFGVGVKSNGCIHVDVGIYEDDWCF